MVKRIMLFLFAIAFALQISLADNTYKLASNCQDGVILHCFDWTFNQIKNRIPEIAAAGYTSVQTSPAQANGGGSTWYWLYDPYGFRLGNALGSQQDLTNLCTEASKYGVKVIVDVVANHLAGGDSGKAGYYSGIDSEFKNDEYWHDRIDNIDYGNRYSITRGRIGLPDLNSENSFVQGKVKDYIATLKSCGVSGIRWDAAKHIALPQDWDNASGSFWSNVLDHTMYNYGEVLDSPCSSDDGTLSKRYCSLMSITDNNYGNGVAGYQQWQHELRLRKSHRERLLGKQPRAVGRKSRHLCQRRRSKPRIFHIYHQQGMGSGGKPQRLLSTLSFTSYRQLRCRSGRFKQLERQGSRCC